MVGLLDRRIGDDLMKLVRSGAGLAELGTIVRDGSRETAAVRCLRPPAGRCGGRAWTGRGRSGAGGRSAPFPAPRQSLDPDLTTAWTSHPPAGSLMPEPIGDSQDFAFEIALVARDFDPVSLGDVIDALDDPRRRPRRGFLPRSTTGTATSTNAWPILGDGVLVYLVALRRSTMQGSSFWRTGSVVLVADAESETVDTPIGPLPVGPGAAEGDGRSTSHVSRPRPRRRAARGPTPLGRDSPCLRRAGDSDGTDTLAPAILDWDEPPAAGGRRHARATPSPAARPGLARSRRRRDPRPLLDLERETGKVVPVPSVLAYPADPRASRPSKRRVAPTCASR